VAPQFVAQLSNGENELVLDNCSQKLISITVLENSCTVVDYQADPSSRRLCDILIPSVGIDEF